jgi:hypothetical protein
LYVFLPLIESSIVIVAVDAGIFLFMLEKGFVTNEVNNIKKRGS